MYPPEIYTRTFTATIFARGSRQPARIAHKISNANGIDSKSRRGGKATGIESSRTRVVINTVSPLTHCGKDDTMNFRIQIQASISIEQTSITSHASSKSTFRWNILNVLNMSRNFKTYLEKKVMFKLKKSFLSLIFLSWRKKTFEKTLKKIKIYLISRNDAQIKETFL